MWGGEAWRGKDRELVELSAPRPLHFADSVVDTHATACVCVCLSVVAHERLPVVFFTCRVKDKSLARC